MTTLAIAFLAKHFVCDFLLQSNYQLENKSRYAHPGGFIHAGLHGVATWFVCASFGIPAWLAGADAVIHLHIDWGKSLLGDYLRLTPRDAGFWRLFGLDQLLHYLTYIWIAAWQGG
jgi:hypothetical protein